PNDYSSIVRLEGEADATILEEPSCPLAGCVSSLKASNGQIYVGLSGFETGLSIYGGVSWQGFDYRNSPMDYDGVSDLAVESGTLWVGTQYDGVWSQSAGGLRHYATDDGLVSDLVASISPAESGLWVGHSPIWDGYWHRGGGASYYDGTSWQSFGFGTPLEARFVNAICEKDDGTVVFGTGYPLGNGDVLLKTGDEWLAVSGVGPVTLSNIICGTVDADGRVLLGTERTGLVMIDGDEWLIISAEDGIPSDRVLALEPTSCGMVVVSCGDVLTPQYVAGGICLLNGRDVWIPPEALVPIDSSVTAISIDESAGEWWFGTETGEIFRYSE
ncbi:MAG: hypothetical protein JW941_07305, partial [Candidatus Coatesbacteria bacterium]|nr:hypothetical protein [Candidatus Coatesbacteria bacterium]